ncbi:MAG: hypothetical protein KatS3mg068_0366 [Candidatus Sericytochromatia bacterium]|nr:MAG: hypothetical protein KatS3mg068_0366 [Candidatus Sericytochromatia bacterium]
MITLLLINNSCEEVLSNFFDSENLKKLRIENTNLRIQIDKLQRKIKENEEKILVKDLVISLYDIRHAVEKYSVNNRGEYPVAENLKDLLSIVKPYLPKDFTMDSTYIETIKSSPKGYIFIANYKDQKIVVSNLI